MQYTNQSNTTLRGSYANAASSVPTVTFPKKEQAIVLGAIEGPKLGDYVKAISEITGPKNITFASRMSNNRICIYLSSVQAVDNLIESHGKVTVLDNEICIRRLITPARRIIVSNVSPYIPHETIAAALKAIGLKLVSQISFLRAGIPGDEFSHVLSFRRQVYVTPLENNATLPTSIIIKYEETNQRVFLTFDDMTCFLCKQPNHVVANCPNTTTGSIDPPTSVSLTSPQNITPTNEATLTPIPTSDPTNQSGTVLFPDPNDKTTKKRPISTDSSSMSSLPETGDFISHSRTQDEYAFTSPSLPISSQKKLKRSRSTEIPILTVHLENVRQVMEENPTQFTVNYPTLKCIIENSFGKSDPLCEARRLTDDIPGLLQTLTEIYPHITDKSIKNRCTRLKKKLKHQLQKEEGLDMETQSIASTSSQESTDNNTAAPQDLDPDLY